MPTASGPSPDVAPLRAWLDSGSLVFGLVAVVLVLAPAAHASLPDQSWIPGLYDNADFDDVVLLTVNPPDFKLPPDDGTLRRVPDSTAGRSPSSIVHQLYDFKRGARAGMSSTLMRLTMQKLAIEDMTSLAAYAASRRAQGINVSTRSLVD
jgi:hypothetical protein